MADPIYLDNNSTAPLDKQVLQAMLKDLTSHPLNPSSIHFFGRQARQLLLEARSTIAQFLQVKSREIIFTSGGTESMNLLICGHLTHAPNSHIITTDLDHPCVYHTLQNLEKQGHTITYLSPGSFGAPTPLEIEQALQTNTQLIVLSAANSETGVKLDLEGVAHVAKEHGVPLILDGVALLGKERFVIPSAVMGMGFSSHKIHGPKGCGFAFVRRGFKVSPLLFGGGQENTLRSGTENLPGILGMARAVSLLDQEIDRAQALMQALRDHLEEGLRKEIPDLLINGDGPRIANTTNLYFPNTDGESLLIALDMHKIAVSHASACASGALQPSRVLLNMGFSKDRVACSLRFSLSRMNTKEEINRAIQVVITLVKKFRALECDSHPAPKIHSI